MLEAAYDAWEHDTRTDRSSLLLTKSGGVIALNVRTRAARIEARLVTEPGVELRDSTTAGVGDLVVTRRNQRQLASRERFRFVKNGDAWVVDRLHRNGDVTVSRELHNGGIVRFPRSYVESQVELGYATTATRAQGRTVDTSHVLVDHTTTREVLYVAATRGRAGAHLYVQNEELLGLDAEPPPAPDLDAIDALVAVLGREVGQRTATEVQREAQAFDATAQRHDTLTVSQARPTSSRTGSRQL